MSSVGIGLHHRLRAQLLAVGDAALEAARAVAAAVQAALRRRSRISSWKRATRASRRPRSRRRWRTAFTAGIDIRAWARRPSRRRSHCANEPRPGRHAARDHLEDRRRRLSPCLLGRVDRRHHGRGGGLVGAAHRARLDAVEPLPGTARSGARPRRRCAARGCAPRRRRRAAARGPARRPPRAPSSRGRWRARARCAGRRCRYLSAPARSAWPGRGYFSARRAFASGRLRIGRHHVPPVLVVAVADEQRDRAAQRPTVAHAAEDLDRVALDLHASAAPVAALAAAQVGVDRARSTARPAGRPSTTTVSAGPCDSPAVSMRSTPVGYPKTRAARAV